MTDINHNPSTSTGRTEVARVDGNHTVRILVSESDNNHIIMTALRKMNGGERMILGVDGDQTVVFNEQDIRRNCEDRRVPEGQIEALLEQVRVPSAE